MKNYKNETSYQIPNISAITLPQYPLIVRAAKSTLL